MYKLSQPKTENEDVKMKKKSIYSISITCTRESTSAILNMYF